VATLRELVDGGRRDDAVAHLREAILPSGAGIAQLVDDLIVALSQD
jgi:hypothetical protein